MSLKTIFLGNGINHLGGEVIPWDQLLLELMGENKFSMDSLPNLMTYEKLRLNWEGSNGTTETLKQTISQKMKGHPGNEFCQKILESGFNNYITTNYDYALESSFLKMNDNNRIENKDKKDKITERLYSIRRNISLINNEKEVGKVWHIHGEIEHFESIMLGMNHYCGSVSKIDAYLKGKYNFKHKKADHCEILTIEEKIKKQSFDGLSWVELFFNSEMHIAGFGFDFNEIDLWYILTKRARIKQLLNPENKIFYYTKPLTQVSEKNQILETRKREMLQSLFVEIIEVEIHNKDYKHQWNVFIDIMNKK